LLCSAREMEPRLEREKSDSLRNECHGEYE